MGSAFCLLSVCVSVCLSVRLASLELQGLYLYLWLCVSVFVFARKCDAVNLCTSYEMRRE